MLKKFTIDDIRRWGPCYDPKRHLPEGWEGTALDILAMELIPVNDRFWVVLREDLLLAKELRLFAVWCVRQVQHLVKDEHSITALDVAEKFAHGEATKKELRDAYAIARAAAAAAATARAAAAAARATAAARTAIARAADAAADAAAADAADAAAAARAAAAAARAAIARAAIARAAAAADAARAARAAAEAAQLKHLQEVFISHGIKNA